MENNTYLHSFQLALPPHHLPEAEVVEWIIQAHLKAHTFQDDEMSEEKLRAFMKRFCVSEKQISTRYYECPDVSQDWSSHKIYNLDETTPGGADIESRALFYRDAAKRVFNELYAQSVTPAHLVHVTCTGYLAPSPPQIYFSSKEKIPAITHAYHMGCYASLPAIRMAKALAKDVSGDVDIVHTEMCSLHLHPESHTPEQMVVQTLFADGHIKYTCGIKPSGSAFKVLRVEERLVPDSLDDMTWVTGSHGMKMTLSRDVPAKIKTGIREFIAHLCDSAQLDMKDVLSKGLFAIHPGGPKIIDSVQEILGLSEEQISASRKILFERGNMSSATLPHVWNEIINQKPANGRKVVSLAFGPGLTMFGGVFEFAK